MYKSKIYMVKIANNSFKYQFYYSKKTELKLLYTEFDLLLFYNCVN